MKKALLFHGGWEGHEPTECAQLLAAELPRRGIEVELSATLDVLSDESRLRTFDVIIPLWTMGTITADQEKNLVQAIKGGVGLAGFHGGMGDAFRGQIDYQWMVGGQFVSHPDNFKNYRVAIAKPSDPIVAGIGDFDVYTEQYYMLIDPGMEVLANTTFGASEAAPWVQGTVMPVIWKKRFGLGRVFYSALGHSAKEFRQVPGQLEITLRGISWAAATA